MRRVWCVTLVWLAGVKVRSEERAFRHARSAGDAEHLFCFMGRLFSVCGGVCKESFNIILDENKAERTRQVMFRVREKDIGKGVSPLRAELFEGGGRPVAWTFEFCPRCGWRNRELRRPDKVDGRKS